MAALDVNVPTISVTITATAPTVSAVPTGNQSVTVPEIGSASTIAAPDIVIGTPETLTVPTVSVSVTVTAPTASAPQRQNAYVARCLLPHLMRVDPTDRTFPPGWVETRNIAADGGWSCINLTTNLDNYPSRVFWHWWVDGRYAGVTHARKRAFRTPPGRTTMVEVKPTRYRTYRGSDRNIDPLAGEVTLQFQAADDADSYLVQYQPSGGDWTTFAIMQDDGRWCYSVRTPQLDDDTEYSFRVVPRDSAQNEGSALSLGTHRVVRYPDPIEADVTWNEGSDTFTFDEA